MNPLANASVYAAGVLAAFFFAASVYAQGQPDSGMIEKVKAAIPRQAPVKPKQPRNILVFSRTAGFRHSSIPIGVRAISLMGDQTGAYTVTATEDESFFDVDKLNQFDAVFMLNTTGNCLRPKGGSKEEQDRREEEYKRNLVDFVTSGKGLIGIHSATDTYTTWKDYNRMMGGAFDGHPWNANSQVTIKNVAPDHPVNAMFGGKGFEITDEIYQFRGDTALQGDRKYLLTLDNDKTNISIGKRKDRFYPISWISTFGKGRVFYCSLGHREDIFWNPLILQHYLAGIQYALGDLEADASPNFPSEK
ncbi:MAG: ThuA domain-containing protein [Candidatus Bilamarchaeaceae archaeon]